MYDRVNDSIEQDWPNFPHSNSQSVLFYNLDILKYYNFVIFYNEQLIARHDVCSCAWEECVQNYEIKGNEYIKRKKIIK